MHNPISPQLTEFPNPFEIVTGRKAGGDSARKDERAAAMERLVDGIFLRLDRAGVASCILRNRDAIPDGLLGWSDVDIMVPGTVKIEELVSLFADLRPAQICPVRAGILSFFFPAADLFLRVDFFIGDPEWRGVPFIDHRDVLGRRRPDRGYPVASPLDQALVAWLTKMLWGGHFPARYEAQIADAITSEPDAARAVLARAFGDGLAHHLVELARIGRIAESASLVQVCRRELWRTGLRRHPVGTPVALLRQITDGAGQRLRPTGIDVALLGPDGAGKTSVASELAALPSRRVAYGRVVSQTLYRRVLPPFSRIASTVLRRPVRPAGNAIDPHGTPSHHPLVWALKYAYYLVDQWLEQAWVRRQLAHANLIVRDRHLMELPIDARRYRYAGPAVIAMWIARLVPKPTLVIVLDAPLPVLRERKQEVPLEETARQRAAYRDLAMHHPNGHIVRTDQPMDSVLEEVLRIVNTYAATRTMVRYSLRGSLPSLPTTPPGAS